MGIPGLDNGDTWGGVWGWGEAGREVARQWSLGEQESTWGSWACPRGLGKARKMGEGIESSLYVLRSSGVMKVGVELEGQWRFQSRGITGCSG